MYLQFQINWILEDCHLFDCFNVQSLISLKTVCISIKVTSHCQGIISHPAIIIFSRTARTTVAPLALFSNVIARLIHLSGAPGLVVWAGYQGTVGVHQTIEPEGEDAGLMG